MLQRLSTTICMVQVWHMQLDAMRNRIIRLNLHLDFAGIATMTATLPAALFGMNLINGLEEVPGYFQFVSACSVAWCFVLYGALVRYFSRPLYNTKQRLADMSALQDLLGYNVDIVGEVCFVHAVSVAQFVHACLLEAVQRTSDIFCFVCMRSIRGAGRPCEWHRALLLQHKLLQILQSDERTWHAQAQVIAAMAETLLQSQCASDHINLWVLRVQVVARLRRMHKEKIDKDVFRQVVHEVVGPSDDGHSILKDEKLNLLYRTLDTDHDGFLDIHELECHFAGMFKNASWSRPSGSDGAHYGLKEGLEAGKQAFESLRSNKSCKCV